MNNKMSNVRDLLITTMEKLVNGDEEPLEGQEPLKKEDRMTPQKASEIAKLGKVLIDSAKTEIAYIKALDSAHQGTKAPSDFIGNVKDSGKQLDY